MSTTTIVSEPEPKQETRQAPKYQPRLKKQAANGKTEPQKPVPAYAHDKDYRAKLSRDAQKMARQWSSNGEYEWARQWENYAKALVNSTPHEFMTLTQPKNLGVDSMIFQKFEYKCKSKVSI